MKAEQVPTTVQLGRILREDARIGVPLNMTIAACRAALDDSDTSPLTMDAVRKHLDELLELQKGQ